MQKKRPLDAKGYYRILKVDPGVGVDEIRLAAAIAKQNAAGPHLKKIDEAYDVLSNTKSREIYDKEGLERPNLLKSPLTLAVCAMILILAILLLWIPTMKLHGKTFTAGQTLVETRTGKEFGTVVRADHDHLFSQGIMAPAYLVRPADGAPERWYPAIDLQRMCDAR